MGLRLSSVLSIVLAAAAMIGPARAQMPAPGSATGPMPNTGPVYIITYFEVGDAATKPTADALRQYAAATRKEDGNTGFVALEEIARPARLCNRRGLARQACSRGARRSGR